MNHGVEVGPERRKGAWEMVFDRCRSRKRSRASWRIVIEPSTNHHQSRQKSRYTPLFLLCDHIPLLSISRYPRDPWQFGSSREKRRIRANQQNFPLPILAHRYPIQTFAYSRSSAEPVLEVVSPKSELNSWTTLPDLSFETLKVPSELTTFSLYWNPNEKPGELALYTFTGWGTDLIDDCDKRLGVGFGNGAFWRWCEV